VKTKISLCKNIFSNVWDRDVWPPNSPDLNSLDYSIWSILESRVYATRHASLDLLKAALTKAWNEITVEELEGMVDNFPKRLRRCIQTKGGYFEQLL